MKIQEVNTPKGERYIVLDNNFKVIKEVKEYLKFLDNLDKAQNTLKNYAQNLKIFYEFLDEENLSIEDVLKNDSKHKGPLQTLSNFIVWLQYPQRYHKIIAINGEEQIRTNQTVNHIVGCVLGFYDYLAKNKNYENIEAYKELRINPKFKGFLSEMKAKQMTCQSSLLKLKETKTTIKYITRKQYNDIFNVLKNNRDKIIAALMFEGGLRISEVLGLHIEDLELWDNKINIVDRRDNPNKATVKNKSEGCIYIPDYVVELIQNYLIDDIVDIDTNFLIINFNGPNKYQPMNENAIEQQYITISEKVNFKVHPHMLRHGFATERLANGYQLIDIKEALRHKNIQSTTIYTDITNEQKKEKTREFYDDINIDFSLDEALNELFKDEINKEDNNGNKII